MAHRTTTEKRIEHIAEMMRRLEWRTGRTGREMARKWGLSLSRVEHLSAEASRRVRAEIADPAAVHQTVCTALDRVLRDALADGDRRNVIRAGMTLARVAGAMVPERMRVLAEPAPLQAMTLAEVEIRVKNAAEAIEAAKRAGGLDVVDPGLAEPKIGLRVNPDAHPGRNGKSHS